jgi:nitronate monooxygenase
MDAHLRDTVPVRRPVVVAPMAGGVSTPALVTAAAQAGALGFLAAGYRPAAAMREDIDSVRARTAAPFGVNVFVPGAPADDAQALARYVGSLAAEERQLGVAAAEPAWDDDDWAAKIADLIARPVPVVSFTFGCPPPDVVAALQGAGTGVWVTVTDEPEAGLARDAGADCLVVQGAEAGGHRGAFSDHCAGASQDRGVLELVAAVGRVTSLPLVAAGGLMSADVVAAAIAAGAIAAQCGTAFLRCPESGAHPAYKAALADPRFDQTAVTRAFSGRPARGLVNSFMRAHPDAPAGYPEINNATRPLRAAAVRLGDVQRMSMWAGEGYRLATENPAAEVIDRLCGDSVCG